MDEAASKSAVPWHYWLISVLSLLWNSMGGYDYVKTRTHDMAYLDMSTGGHGQAFADWMGSVGPAVQFGWPLGVWTSFAGSLLLLARSRHAVTAFLVSLVCSVISIGTEHLGDIPAELNSGSMKIMETAVIVLIALQWWYSRRAASKGYLR